MVEEEKKKREKFDKEIKEKREWWMTLERGYNKWEEEIRMREKEIGEKEEEKESMRRDMANKEEEMREDCAREYKVFIV